MVPTMASVPTDHGAPGAAMMRRKKKNPASTDRYASIGYLFYSIAAADKRVTPAEADRLQQELDTHWRFQHLPTVGDRHAAPRIMSAFNSALREGMAAEVAYQHFVQEFQQDPSSFARFTQALMSTAIAIASAYARRNKSELVRLSRLKSLIGA